MKKLITAISLALLILLSIAFPARAATDPVQQKLELELEKMIDAGHMRPGYFLCVEFYVNDTKNVLFDFGHHYFHNPADTIYTLCRALPLVQDSNAVLYQDLRNYIQSEWAAFPPTQYTHVGFNSGVGREGVKFPAEVLTAWRGGGLIGQGSPRTASDGFPGWSFNPFNFYACWKYADEFGGAASIFAAVENKVEHYPDDANLAQMPHVLNSYIAGYIGYLELEELAGEPKSTDVETWLNELKSKILVNLQTHPRDISATEAGGFLWLVPELGDYLYENAESLVRQRVEQHSLLCPYWMQAFAGETTRHTGGSKMAEGTTSHLYEYSSMFQAKALALKESREELELDLDVPRFHRGDLFYIQNLMATLEAGGSSAILAATGHAALSGPLDNTTAYQAGADAATMANSALGGNVPQLVLVSDNLGGSRQSMLDGVASVFNANTIFGCTSYQAMTEATNQDDVSVMAIAGDIEVYTYVYSIPGFSATQADGEAVATALQPYVPTDDTNSILLLTGWMHTPDNNAVTIGAQNILGTDFPIAGDSGSPVVSGQLFVYSQGTVQGVGRNLLGILINGNFEIGWGFNEAADYSDSIVDSAAASVSEAVDGDYTETQLIFAFDCGSRRDGSNNAYPEELTAMVAQAPGIPIWGFYGSGEIGRDYPGTAPSYGENKHLSAVAIKATAMSGPTNQAPYVNAGSDQQITLPDDDVALDGTVTDDGLPNPPAAVTVTWTKESGPGTVSFGNANAVDTTATFSIDGVYVLRLTASDSELNNYDETTITVNAAGGNVAPTVDAGSNQSITLPDNDAALDGTVSDDGLPNPPAAVTVTWTRQSGAGTVTFANENAVDTSATFSAAGIYVLRLTASDSELSNYDEVTITVNPETSAIAIPGKVEAESYKAGGEGVAYHDTTVGNSGNATEFTDDVDVAVCSDTGGGYNVAYIVSTEWIAYDVDIAYAGTYDITARVATGHTTNKTLHIEIGGQSVSGPITFNTGGAGWQTFQDATVTGISLNAGPQEIRIVMDSSDFNLNYVNFTLVAAANQAPNVDAGSNQQLILPTNTASLDGTVTDDGLPNPPAAVTVTWTKQTGPGTVNFANQNTVDTVATFSAEGVYVLRLTASDSELSNYDEMTVTVEQAGTLPAPWQQGDVGAVAAAGDAGYASGTFTVSGSGENIWNTVDEFHYVYQILSGDGEISARVVSMDNTSSWARAGVMVRETLATGSKNVLAMVTPGSGAGSQARFITDDVTTGGGDGASAAPYWVKVVRTGDIFRAYISPDGVNWTQHNTDRTIAMSTDVYIGLAVCSRVDGTLCTAVFDNVSMSGAGADTNPPAPDPLTWATVPYSTGMTSISMTATTASDPSGVEYYFECTAGGGHNSGWQDSTTYQDTGLSSGMEYTYRVQARDKSANQNTTGWSTALSATTDYGEGPAITNIVTNESQYPGGQVPAYSRFELSFDVATLADEIMLPYDAAPPSGVTAAMGVSVDAEFTPDNWATVYSQPGFFYKSFERQLKSNRDWIYPDGNDCWQVRFAPNSAGTWKYRIKAHDSSGLFTTTENTFTVAASGDPGFLQVSSDPRYFEYENGEMFPGLGYNLTFGTISFNNPVKDNDPLFSTVSSHGMQLFRTWLTHWGIYGSAWISWSSPLQSLHGIYIPSPSLSMDYAYQDNEVSMKLQWDYNPGMWIGHTTDSPAIKQNTDYHIFIRYNIPTALNQRIGSYPYGLCAKTSRTWLGGSDVYLYCDPGTGTVISNYASAATAGWQTLEGSFNSGADDFIGGANGYFILCLENVDSSGGIAAYIDEVEIREDLGGGQYGPNIIGKDRMCSHLTYDQKKSYAFDRTLELAEQYDIYFKLVLLEKNEWIGQRIDHSGNLVPTAPLVEYFYGNFRNMTKNRWLQQAFWRYCTARWGYSPHIQSWELLNEGDPFNGRHYTQTDEFGAYMHQYEANKHVITTSTWHSFPKDNFWANTGYPEVDYADYHNYPASFNDIPAKLAEYNVSYGALQPGGAGKPMILGETGYSAEVNSDTAGIWYHNFTWANSHPGGVYQQYWCEYNEFGQAYDVRQHNLSYRHFIEDIPLNNGNYQDIAATVSDPNIRAWGQKDLVNGNAHVWIQNDRHTWYNIVNSNPVGSVTGTVQIGGFSPSQQYSVEWWDTYEPVKSLAIISTDNVYANGSGVITLSVSNLTDDIAARIFYAGAPDTTPPTPDPLTWATAPYSTGTTSISMTATTASDPSGVEYFFDCTAGGGHDSGWQSSATYQDTGLSPSTQYTYRVQARDLSANQNATGWSTSQSATTDSGVDVTPPTPNPMTWATLPYAVGANAVSMTATTASDPSGVEYYFECTAGGGNDSGWQAGTTYQDTGLSSSTLYTYRVRARDLSVNNNQTNWSTTQSATTSSSALPTIGALPLNDLGSGTWGGQVGGLYPGASNQKPAATNTAAINIATNQIQPLNASGNPDAVNGKIAMISIGMSNTTQEFTEFVTLSNADLAKNPKLQIVDCAIGGAHSLYWLDPDEPTTWGVADTRLTNASLTPEQVQVAWVKQAVANPDTHGAFPAHAQYLQGHLETIARNLKINFPNIKLVYFSSRTRAFVTVGLNPEPYAYESGFSVRWMIENQTNGTGNLNWDSGQGTVVAPLILWGPYIWADGENPRSDGFIWLDSDTEGDGIHPSDTGEMKVAVQLKAFFKTDPSATPWFLDSAVTGQAPTAAIGCDNSSGAEGLVVNFTANASDPDGSIVAYEWTFDDGCFSLAENPTKSFPAAGSYNVTLTVTDNQGNTAVDTQLITVGTPPDVTAPTPDPLTWASAPASTGTTSIAMTATTASDPSGVEYYFDCTAGAGHDSGWQSSASYTDTGLTPDTQYTYRVQARDLSANQNTGGWSTSEYATTDPVASWTQLTYDDFESGWGNYTSGGADCLLYTEGTYAHQGSNAADIQDDSGEASSFYLTNGIDVTGYSQIKVEFWYYPVSMDNSSEDFWVQYYDGSNWQTVRAFVQGTDFVNNNFYEVADTDIIIDSGTYNFPTDMRVRFMCDASGNADDIYIDEVRVSAQGGTPPDTTPPTPDPLTWATMPYSTGTSSISMTATTASDPSGVEYYFDCTAGGDNDSGWQASPSYSDTGLAPNTLYTYRVQARDLSANQNAGSWSTSESATTDALPGVTAIPGRLEPEDYKPGGEGVDWHDTTAGNSGNATEFTDDVDVSVCTEGGYNIGNIQPDEWLDIDVDVAQTGLYTVTARVATDYEGTRSLHLEVGGLDVSGPIQFTTVAGGGWQTFFDVNVPNVSLTAGAYEMRVWMDASSFNLNYIDFTYQGAPDTTAPTPDPLTWATLPHSTGTTSISMTATTASDPSGVEYYFDCTAGGGHDSGWQDSTTYQDTGLSPSTQYTYRVQARDKSANQNAGGWSTSESATTDAPPDTTPPTPDPLTWATLPHSTGTTSVSMTATTASDPSGVEYYFDCTAGGGHDSGWQDSTTYQDTGLSPSTQYTYSVQARDKSANQNAGGWSTSESATTDAPPDTTPPTPDPLTWATMPYSTGTTSISMTATTASDPSGVEYYFDCTAGGGHDSAWQDSTTYQDTGLTPSTQYSYRVQARDKSANQNTGSWSTTQSATTDAGGAVTLLQDGFETSFDNWTDGGTTDWDRATDQKHSGSYSAHAGSADNDLISDNLDTAGCTSITVSFWYRDDDIDDGDNIYLQLYDGSSYVNRFELGNSTEDTWHYYEETINNSGGDAAYFISNFRIKFEGSSIDSGENLWIDDVLVTAEGGTPPQTWLNTDVGAVGAAGSYSEVGGTFTVEGAGENLWNTADEFHFVYQTLSGDGEISARVVSVENTNSWARAGVMIRETLATGSTYVLGMVTPGNGSGSQGRLVTDDTTTGGGDGTNFAPYWVKVTRAGNLFQAFISPDGVNWTQHSTDRTITMATDVYVGLAVCSRVDATLCTAEFDNVSVIDN